MAEGSLTRVVGAGEGDLVAVPGVLGWRNDRDESTEAQLQLYGAAGRWEERRIRGRRVSGASLVEEVIAQGASEGASLVLLAANRFAKPVTPDQLVALVRAVAPELVTPA